MILWNDIWLYHYDHTHIYIYTHIHRHIFLYLRFVRYLDQAEVFLESWITYFEPVAS